MARVKIAYYAVRNGRGYWQPKPAMRRLGFEPTACGPDGPDAWAIAEALNAKWREYSREAEEAPEPIPARGSLAEAFARYRATAEWTEKKAPRTREEWERCWARIEPIFGNAKPSSVTLDQVSRFREAIARTVSQREAHRIIKVWRALWRIAAALKYCVKDADPSLGVTNTEPERRQYVWTFREMRLLRKTAWREGYRGLAVAITVLWDAGLSPVDVRKLTPSQRREDDQGIWFELDRAKTGRAAVATLSRAGARILDAYLAGLGAELRPDAPIVRNRSGRAYSKDTMGDDFRDIRALAFGPDEPRTMLDFRRSVLREGMRGGADLTLAGQKLANDVGSNPSLARTYAPTDVDTVRAFDKARKRGRK
jgi:hypothetical protein